MMTERRAIPSRNLVLAGLLAAALTGCAVVPPAVAPANPPAAWPDELAAYAVAKPATPPNYSHGDTAPNRPDVAGAGWPAYFQAPGLQGAIRQALAANRDIALATARLDEVRAQSAAASGTRWPTVDLNTQRSLTHVPTAVGSSPDSHGTRQRYDVNVSMAWELDFWGRLKSADNAARAAFLASEQARESVRLGVIAATASGYYDVLDAYAREALLTTLLRNREARRGLVQQRASVGLAAAHDVAAADAAAFTARADALAASRQRVAAQNALRLLTVDEPDWPTLRQEAGLAEPLEQIGAAAPRVVPPLPGYPPIYLGLPADVLLKRPDVRAAEQRLVAAAANIEAARAAFFPRIALTTSAGTASDALNGLFSAGSSAWSFVPALKLPLFDGARHQADLDIAAARRVVAVAEYEQVVQQAFREVADALASAAYGAPSVNAAQAAAEAQTARLALIDRRLDAGVINRIEWLDAQVDAITAQIAQRTAMRQTSAAATAAFRAAGGF